MFLKEFFENFNFEKVDRRQKHKKLPSIQRINWLISFLISVSVQARQFMQSTDADDPQEKADEQFNIDIVEILKDDDIDDWRLRDIITAIVVCTQV